MMNYFSSLLFRRAVYGQDGKGKRKVGRHRPVRIDARPFCETLEDRTAPAAGLSAAQPSAVLQQDVATLVQSEQTLATLFTQTASDQSSQLAQEVAALVQVESQ